MMDPVVSSRYGKRPLLEIPPMTVNGYSNVEVPSLNLSGATANYDPFPVGKGEPYNITTTYTIGGLPSAPPRQAHGNSRSNPAAQAYPAPQHNPNVEQINTQHQTQYPGVPSMQQPAYPGVPTMQQPTYPGVQPMQQPTYPGVVNPYGSYQVPQHSNNNNSVPKIMYDHYDMSNRFSSITCSLEYGRIVNINMKESRGEFQGIPPFLRDELMRSYGKYPFTKVKLTNENGEFHIYASHFVRGKGQDRGRRRREEREDPYPFREEDTERGRSMADYYDNDHYSWHGDGLAHDYDSSIGYRRALRENYYHFQDGFGEFG